MNILLVEDDESHAELIRRAFQSQAESVALTIAATLREAQEAVAETTPDLALADLVLPDGKGVELLTAKGETGRFPIVIMTSHGDEEAAVDAMKAGALHYVVKSDKTLANMPQIAEGALREWRHLLERERAEAALHSSERRYRTLYDDTPSMFFTVGVDGGVVSVNRFAAEQLGYSVDELIGRPYAALCVKDENDDVASHLEKCFASSDGLHRWEICKRRKDDSRIWVRTTARTVQDEKEPVALLVCEDITEAHQLSRKLSYQASHDPLTSLPNRREFEYRLERAFQEARAERTEHALCYLDLDQFKVINDTCGHIAGDMLLRQLGGLLLSRIRKRDTLARLGGDEFGVLIKYCAPADALRVAESLRKVITEFRFVWEDKSFNVGVSIGLVPIDETCENITGVLAAADSACYAAKDQGRNRIHIYHEQDADLAKRYGEMQWVSRIHKALEEDLFRLSYQPIVPVDAAVNGHRKHYEVLIRMIADDESLIGPGAFLPAAERYNIIDKVDHWVVAKALAWLTRHPRHLENLHLCSINLSGHSLGSSEFLDFAVRQLDENEIPAEKICFEITETAAISNLASATRFIQTLKELGCQFALDDFGSGLSSFAYLKSLPVDFVKIDGIFIKDIVTNPIDLAVVTSINEIGHVMGKQTIAEFVEDEAILEKLREIGVDYAQGYGIGRPQSFAELT